MSDVNYLAVLGAGIAVFAFAAVYYTVLAPLRMQLSPAAAAAGRPPAWLMVLELVKALFVAWFVILLITALGVTEITTAVLVGLGLWLAFPVVLLIGSVTQEKTPLKLAVIHAGDWLAKLMIVSVVAALFA